jgi:hypothetical protein
LSTSPVRYSECVRNNLASNVSPKNADKDKGDDNSNYKTVYTCILYYYNLDSYFITAIGIYPEGLFYVYPNSIKIW